MKFNCEIVEHIATIGSSTNVTKELNRVIFNGGEAKLDLRNWIHNQQGVMSPLKGVTLSGQEAAALRDALISLQDI